MSGDNSLKRFERYNAEKGNLKAVELLHRHEISIYSTDTGGVNVSLQPLAQASKPVYNTVRRWAFSKACPTKRSDVNEEVNQDGSLPGLWPITARRM